MTARSAARRKAREAAHSLVEPIASNNGDSDALLALIRQLPRSARIVATLALHGMTREEIAYVLDLSPTALRQRLTTIRRTCKDRSDSISSIDSSMTMGQELETGVLRRSLLAVVQRQAGLGIHDPDGHLIVIERDSTSHRRRPRQRQKGKPQRRR
jgi:RNA polymerase sigma-70 factor (ECF subfamily)